MSDSLKEERIHRIIVQKPQTVAELLTELDLSDKHVVLVNGKKVPLEFQISENESIVILPLIAGG